jgi:hypothetical protein
LISQFAVTGALAEEAKNNESELQETVVTPQRYETRQAGWQFLFGDYGQGYEQRKKTTVKDMLRECPV